METSHDCAELVTDDKAALREQLLLDGELENYERELVEA